MPDGLVNRRGFQLAVLDYWKWEAFSKNNANYFSGSVPILFRVGAAGRGGMLGCAAILHNNPYNFQGDCVGCWE